jgi:hypothetical protein
MKMNLRQLINWGDNPVMLTEDDDLRPAEYRPMTELDHFVSKTKSMVDGLEEQITDLDAEITRQIARLNDLKLIREAQALALRHMEGGSGE